MARFFLRCRVSHCRNSNHRDVCADAVQTDKWLRTATYGGTRNAFPPRGTTNAETVRTAVMLQAISINGMVASHRVLLSQDLAVPGTIATTCVSLQLTTFENILIFAAPPCRCLVWRRPLHSSAKRRPLPLALPIPAQTGDGANENCRILT